MARGDVVNQITTGVGTGQIITYQPSGGVQVMVTACGVAGTNLLANHLLVGIYNGSSQAWMAISPPGHPTENVEPDLFAMKIFIDNTNYFMAKNDSGNTRIMWFTGITTK
jgi:sugar (pentulose or hexulose) kinase